MNIKSKFNFTSSGNRPEVCDLFRHRCAITRATTIRNTAISTDNIVVCNSCEILAETFRSVPSFLPPLTFTFSLVSTPNIMETSMRLCIYKE